MKTSVRRSRFHLSETWPQRELFLRVSEKLQRFVSNVANARTAVPPVASSNLASYKVA